VNRRGGLWACDRLQTAIEDAAEQLAKNIAAGRVDDTADALRDAEAVKFLAEALAWIQSPNSAH
jgi:hypothetical protein